MSRKYGFKIKGKEIIVKKKMNGREGQGGGIWEERNEQEEMNMKQS